MKWISRIIILTALEIAFVMAILKAIFGLSTALSFGIVSIILALVFAFALGVQIIRRRYEREPVLDSPFDSDIATENESFFVKASNYRILERNIGRYFWDKKIVCEECQEPSINFEVFIDTNEQIIDCRCKVCDTIYKLDRQVL